MFLYEYDSSGDGNRIDLIDLNSDYEEWSKKDYWKKRDA